MNPTIVELFDRALHSRRLTQTTASEKLGWSVQKLNRKINTGAFKLQEFLDVMDVLGFDVELVDRETGKFAASRTQGAGERVKMMVSSVLYDTATSDALSNDFYTADPNDRYGEDGTAKELYLSKEGRYFFVYYFRDRKPRVVPCTGEAAAMFVEKYGSDLYRGPAE